MNDRKFQTFLLNSFVLYFMTLDYCSWNIIISILKVIFLRILFAMDFISIIKNGRSPLRSVGESAAVQFNNFAIFVPAFINF